MTWTAYYATTADTFGTLASPTRTQISTGTFTVTSTLTNYSTNISIPAAATTGVEIVFTVGAQISGTWVIGNIQLEKGSTATSFDYRPYGTELALCQRYYYKQQATSTISIFGSGFNNSTTVGVYNVNFPVTLRTDPSALEQSGTAANYQIYYAGNVAVCSAVPTFNGGNVWGASVVFTVASGLTTGQASLARSASASAYLGWSAEL